MLGLMIVGTLASLAAAVCGALCLRRLKGEKLLGQMEGAVPEEDDEGDGTLREGLLNLMRYDPERKEEKEA